MPARATRRLALVAGLVLAVAAGPVAATGHREPEVQVVASPWASDDVATVAQLAGEVVIARVDAVLGPARSAGLPSTRVRVHVDERLKGSLDGDVEVVQLGGPHPHDGHLVLVGGDQALRPGTEHLLALRRRDGDLVCIPVGGTRLLVGGERVSTWADYPAVMAMRQALHADGGDSPDVLPLLATRPRR